VASERWGLFFKKEQNIAMGSLGDALSMGWSSLSGLMMLALVRSWSTFPSSSSLSSSESAKIIVSPRIALLICLASVVIVPLVALGPGCCVRR